MRPSPRAPLLAAFLVALTTGAARAGPPHDRPVAADEVLGLLRCATDARAVAWGAWLAPPGMAREAGR